MNLKVWIPVLFVLAVCCCMWIYQPFEDPSLTESGPTYAFVWNHPQSAAGGDNQMVLQWHVLQAEWLAAVLGGVAFHLYRGTLGKRADLPRLVLLIGTVAGIAVLLYPAYTGAHWFLSYNRRGWLFHHLSEESLNLPAMKLELAAIFVVTSVAFFAAMMWNRRTNLQMLESHQGSV